MFTVCSKCNLRLTVTATDLRAAQGYVRCGRCHNVFNALAALADDPARLAEQPAPTDTQSRRALTLPEPPAPEPAAPEALASTDTALEFNPASTNINEVFIEAASDEHTGTFESIIISGEDPALAPQALSAPADPTQADESIAVDVQRLRDALAEPEHSRPVMAPAAPAALPEPVPPDPEPVYVAPAARGIAAEPPEEEIPFTTTWAAVEPVAVEEDPVAVQALLEAGAERGSPGLPRWVLQGTAAILTLCLLGQALHHYRLPLAETALLHRPLTSLYRLLGQPLEARWDIGRYEIRQLGATADSAAAGALVVRASISNHASRVQPLPLLRVVMQDRFGNRVAARDLTPAEYLGRGAPQVSLMAPGQRVDVQVAFQDPGRAATGFEIDACMPGHGGAVLCANDPGTH